MYIIEWTHESLFYINDTHTKFSTNLNVKYASILIVYHKSHGFGIRVIYGVGNRTIIRVAIIKIYLLL